MDQFVDFLKLIFVLPEHVRVDAFLLYIVGMIYYTYLHRKHDGEVVRGFKGENGLWEAPEYVVYIWVQSFPFVLFADQFLGLYLSDGMQYIFTLVLFFAIMGRAGIELMPILKNKFTAPPSEKTKEEELKP